jgi:alginate O-acetyltransferase complex protein AlgJ
MWRKDRRVVHVALLVLVFAALAGGIWAAVFRHHKHLDPETARLIERERPLWDAVATGQRVVNWLTAGYLGPRVVVGCPGWLFLNDELEVRRTREAGLAAHLKIVEQAAGFIARHHVPLVVVLVPDKTRVESYALGQLKRPGELQDRLGRMTASLRDAGIQVVDLLPALLAAEGDTYYRTDLHWNERGASHAAAAVAAYLRQAGLATDQKAVFQVSSKAPRERVGDLISIAGLNRMPFPLRPRGDIVSLTAIEQSAPAGTGILDETTPPDTVLLGTSFSRTANFNKFLALSLGAPIADWAQKGGGLTGSAAAYLAAPQFKQSPPRIVIWELPEVIMSEKRVLETEKRWGDDLARAP